MPSSVIRSGIASSQDALAHFEKLLQYETDCWDVHFALNNNRQDFVLLDVRGTSLFAQSHIQGAINLPHQKIDPQTLSEFSNDTLFVVYCAGPHCNATEKAAIKLAQLNRPVKKMIGGITGWLDEGFTLVPESFESAAS